MQTVRLQGRKENLTWVTFAQRVIYVICIGKLGIKCIQHVTLQFYFKIKLPSDILNILQEKLCYINVIYFMQVLPKYVLILDNHDTL